MSLKEQRYICTLAECGSITEAAKQLYITQPALSMFVSTLEKSMDVQLFDRSGKNLKLTYAGEVYVEKARLMLELQDELDILLGDIRKGVSGRIKVGLQKRRSSTLTVDIIKMFREKYPQVELQFVLGEWTSLIQNYNDNQIDVLMYNDQFGIGPGEGEILSNERVLLVASQNSPLYSLSRALPGENYRWIDIHDVDDLFILPSHESSLRNDVEVLCRKNSYRIKDFTEIALIETAMQMAAEGMGVCFSRETYASSFNYKKTPLFFITGDPILTSPLCMKYNHELLASEYFVYLLDVIRQCVAKSLSGNTPPQVLQ